MPQEKVLQQPRDWKEFEYPNEVFCYDSLPLNRENSKDRTIDDYRKRVKKLEKENESFKRQIAEMQQESVEVTNLMRNQLEEKDEIIALLTKEAQDITERILAERKAEEKLLHDELTGLRVVIAQKEKQIKELEEEVDNLHEFKQNRHQFLLELDNFKQILDEKKKRYKDKITRLEQKFYEEKSKLQKQFALKIAEVKKQSQEEAVASIGETTKMLFVDNRNIIEELQLHTQQTEKLKSKKQQLEEENRKLLRELELLEERVEEYAKLQQKRKEELKASNARIKELEDDLNEQKLASKSGQKISVKAKKELEEYKLDAEGLRKLLEVKTAELKKIKRLARNVLDQRTELEQFFLESLEEVKKELTKKKELEQLQATKVASGKPSTPPPTSPHSRKADVRDLTWEDKERVLRLLFQKMNNPPQKNSASNSVSRQEEKSVSPPASKGGEPQLNG